MTRHVTNARLRHAHYSLGDYTEASNAFRRGLEIDPSNASLKTGLQNSEARVEPATSTSPPPADVSGGAPGGMGGLADMMSAFGGGGGGGGGGGMPDIASMMQNPMIMQMAQNMMANGGMEELMRNPSLRNMVRLPCTKRYTARPNILFPRKASRFQSGETPSMSELMSDPTIRDL